MTLKLWILWRKDSTTGKWFPSGVSTDIAKVQQCIAKREAEGVAMKVTVASTEVPQD